VESALKRVKIKFSAGFQIRKW